MKLTYFYALAQYVADYSEAHVSLQGGPRM